MFERKFWLSVARVEPDDVIMPEMLQDNAQGFILLPTLLHPYSSGLIELKSNRHEDSPVIHPGYMSDERDLTTLATGALKCVEIANKMGYDNDKICLVKALRHLPVEDIDTWKQQIRRFASTLYHPSSTCAIGKVLDADLRVKGVRRLRVADASAFPHLTSGNTNAPCMMIGEMAADILKAEYGLK